MINQTTMRAPTMVVVACAFFLLISLSSSPLHAQQTGAAGGLTAEQLRHFDIGRGLVQQQRYAEAIPEFLASTEGPSGASVGALLNLADCYERVGKYASAWARFREAERLAVERHDERENVARAAAVELEHRLPTLTVRVAPDVLAIDRLEILLDGTAIPRSSFNRPVPVDPGEHWIIATGAEKKKLEVRTTVSRKGDEVVVRLEDAATRGGGSNDNGARSPTTTRNAPAHSQTQRTLGWAALGVGGVGVVTGVVLGLFALSSRNALSNECPSYPTCPQPASDDERRAIMELNDRGRGEAIWATVALAIGGAASATGIVLLISAPPSSSSPSSGATAPARGASITFGASF